MYSIKECYGVCIEEELVEEYNNCVKVFLENNSYVNKYMFIIDKGRDVDECLVILIENGKYIGFGFFNLNY